MPPKAKAKKPNKETRNFEAEVKKLLDIVIHSLYTHKEIFLRELIANASDALDKLRILSLTEPEILKDDEPELLISLDIDKEKKTLTISDNGIGMTYDEVVENIGTIAKSGSKKFLEVLKQNKHTESDIELIGQFGVGFYSAFMVAEKVTLMTISPKEKMGVKWESMGDGTYNLEAVEKTSRGTQIILYLKDESEVESPSDENFLDQYTIQNLVKKHCNFINYPIRMNFYTEESEKDKDGKVIEGKNVTTVTEKTLNEIKPIWQKDRKEIKNEEYLEFYKQHFHDWNASADILHLKGEGATEFTALLFIPSVAPYNLYSPDYNSGLELYSKNMLIMSDCQELLPEYLKFVKGIVDSADLSLNISREMLQHNRQLRLIGNYLEKKVIDKLKEFRDKKRKKYEEIWKEYGKSIKGGIYTEYKNKEKLQDFLLFESSHSEKNLSTLKEYVERMPEKQKDIFYAVGETREYIENMPQMEVVKEKGVEVLYFTDKVDEFLTQNLHEYEGRSLQSVSRGDLKFGDDQEEDKDTNAEKDGKDESKDEKENAEKDKSQEKYKKLTDLMKEALGDKIKEVRVSNRLASSPVCLVSDSSGYSLNMERLMKDANQGFMRATKILEINSEHDIVENMHAMVEKGEPNGHVKNQTILLYNQALLIEGEKLEDPIDFSKRMSEVMIEALKT
ncbi:MAG: molecular chaperone HtpG [Kiritimatiellae bacterium]|nr:molecular chaperone HtpG [Kiritimatiellia bacterium]